MTDSRKSKLKELLSFGVIGCLAAGIQYIVYWGASYLMSYTLALTVGYGVSLIFNFLANTHYTFKVKKTKKKAVGFLFSHLINYSLQIIFLNILLYMGVPPMVAPIIVFALCAIINFIMVRFFLTK